MISEDELVDIIYGKMTANVVNLIVRSVRMCVHKQLASRQLISLTDETLD